MRVAGHPSARVICYPDHPQIRARKREEEKQSHMSCVTEQGCDRSVPRPPALLPGLLLPRCLLTNRPLSLPEVLQACHVQAHSYHQEVDQMSPEEHSTRLMPICCCCPCLLLAPAPWDTPARWTLRCPYSTVPGNTGPEKGQ